MVNDVIRFISSSANNNNNIVSTQINTKTEFSIDKKIVSYNNHNESKDQDKAIDDKTENKNIIEDKEDDIQRFTENNNSARSSTYNSIF